MTSVDPTRIDIATDPIARTMKGIAYHGNTPFEVPYISPITEDLWQGGCEEGMELPKFIAHIISLYPWERYRLHRGVRSQMYVEMYDSTEQGYGQLDAIASWVNVCRTDGPTLVHCFPDGTMVGGLTPTDITKTHSVIGHDGRAHRVTHHHLDPYDGPLLVIKTTGALDIRVTPEHPFQVVRPYYFPGGFKAKPGMKSLENVGTAMAHYDAQPEWVAAQDIRLGDYLVSPRPIFDAAPCDAEWVSPFAPNAKPVAPLPPDEDTAWMLGLFAADGGTSGPNSITFTLSLADDVERLVGCWAKLGLTARVVDARATPAKSNCFRVIVNSAGVSRSFREWFGKGADKRLPEFLFTHGFPLRSVIEGYADGDGYREGDGTVTCQTISPILMEQVRMILVSLGLSPTLSPARRHSGMPNAKPAWKVQWREAATQHHTAWWHGMYLMPVTGMEIEEYRGDVHNIAVEDAETYTVNGALVHNCQAGLNRSSLVAARALFLDGFGTGETILTHLREQRSPAVLCNPAFEEEVLSWP